MKKYVWTKIAQILSDTFNHSYTGQQCDTKWKGLRNIYKQIKKHNEKSGNDRKNWQFYDIMDEVLFNRPEINARVTCSSTRGLVINNNISTPSNENTSSTIITETGKL